MKFKAKKGAIIAIPVLFLIIMLIFSCFERPFASSKIAFSFVQLILLPVVLYLCWMWFDTGYNVADGKLYYKSALLKGSINIASIHHLEINKNVYSGIKVALSSNGILVKYNRWDDIYIAPEDTAGFVAEIKRINPEITVNG
jgi:energy-coupling factor transporter transmembrane protein EcfT